MPPDALVGQPATAAAVSVERISKAYGATRAVDDVSFSIRARSVHALLGENGAGKSTIVRLLSGLTLPDSGQFQVFGEEMRLIKVLTVLDNMPLPSGPVGPLGTIRRRRARELVSEHFASLGMSDIA